MDPNRKYRMTALAVTLLIALSLIVFLACRKIVLSSPSDREWPPEKHSEIIFEPLEEETFVRVVSLSGDNVTEAVDNDDTPGASDTESTDQTQTTHDAVNSGRHEGTSAPPVTSGQPSPIQQKPAEKPSGNTKPAEDDATVNARRQQQAARNINDKMKNRFSGTGKGEGKTTDTDGTNPSGGKGGGTGLGMTASVDRTPSSDKIGVIVVNVTVLPDGTVERGSARLAPRGNSGPAATDSRLQQKCIEEAYRCRFSRPVGETTKLPGSITFRWTDNK